MTRVFVSRALPGQALERLRARFEVDVWPDREPPPPEVLRQAAAEADGLITMLPDVIDQGLLSGAPGLRIVANLAVGYDNIDVRAATKRGVLITNTPGVLTETVADLTLALMLSLARRLPAGDRAIREGHWGAWKPDFLLGRDLAGATLGIVGLGAIGSAVAKRAAGFGMRILYCSRSAKPEVEISLGAERADLDGVLQNSDFVSLHVALSPETRGMIGRSELKKMRNDALLVNTARGPIVNEEALVRALEEGWIGGAALDVFEHEPLSKTSPLLKLENVVVSPHVGSGTWETRSRMANLCVDNLIAFFDGRQPLTPVNAEVLQ